MKGAEALVLLSTLTSSILAAESTRPRGVGPECTSLTFIPPPLQGTSPPPPASIEQKEASHMTDIAPGTQLRNTTNP